MKISDFCPFIEHVPDTSTGFVFPSKNPQITASVGAACKTIPSLKIFGKVRALLQPINSKNSKVFIVNALRTIVLLTDKKFKHYTVKLGDKERFDKEQIGVKELFTDYQPFYTINLLFDKEHLPI